MAKRKQHWGKTPWTITFRGGIKRLPAAVDFAVVGGGFTGLAAAAWLKRKAPGKSVLLLEAGRLGNGASGRTGGMALAASAAGDLPGLGDVLRGYRKILRDLRVDGDVRLPGVWEIGRGEWSMEGKRIRPLKDSPIDWSDSGRVRAVGQVPGGSVNPGKVLSGLARAAQNGGVTIAEEAEVVGLEFSQPLRLRVRCRRNGRMVESSVLAGKILLATNAGGLHVTEKSFRGARPEPKLTFAIATAPLTKRQREAIGMRSGRPFYTVDIPYLWGRPLRNGGMVFGSGLVPGFAERLRRNGKRGEALWGGLEKVDVRRGAAAHRLRELERRVRGLHPALENIRVTHRWGGPILLTRNFVPVFRHDSRSGKVIVLGGFSGHGVAQSVYLGVRAAECLLGRARVPGWNEERAKA